MSVTAADAPRLTVMEPGAGRVGDLGSIGVQFKLWGEDTNGEVSVVEHPFPVGALVPPHLHTREDEYSIVTEGEIGFRSGSRQVVLAAGGYITKPRGEMHTMWNAVRRFRDQAHLQAGKILAIGPSSPERTNVVLWRTVGEAIDVAISQAVAVAEECLRVATKHD